MRGDDESDRIPLVTRARFVQEDRHHRLRTQADHRRPKITLYTRYGKRVLDLAIALSTSLVLLPFFLLAAILVRIGSPGPLFFRQQRLGQNGKLFMLYKFRTMTDKDRVADREIMPSDPEVTATGKLLRRLKIDELPQLLNVLKGDMSTVGPRPGLPRQLGEAGFSKLRLVLRPGLTGWAQVNGNIHLSWQERYRYDEDYVERVNLLFDCWIICKTIAVIALGEERFVRPPEGTNCRS
jgi:undecaprenyl phosphate N,N'-diacetylbacillosamine 1-phosphate transferase